MSSLNDAPSIFAVRFKETSSGKHFSFSKIKTEYTLLVNHRHEVVIEVTNSRLARKKSIVMNGDVVETFKRTTVSGLRHTWSYPLDGKVIVLSVSANPSNSGSDLLVNGRDFFDYVFLVDSTNPTGKAKGVYDTIMNFIVPPIPSPKRAVPSIASAESREVPRRGSVESDSKLRGSSEVKYKLPTSSGYGSFRSEDDSSEKDSKDLLRY